MQVPIEALFQLCNIFHPDDPADADLLAFLLVSERSGHAEGLQFWNKLIWSVEFFDLNFSLS